jgi:N-acetyltransferase 10
MDTQPVGALVEIVKTLDQAKALLTFIEAISEKAIDPMYTFIKSTI